MQSLFEKYPPPAFSDSQSFITELESFIKKTSAQQLLGIDVEGTLADAKKQRDSLLRTYHSDKGLSNSPQAATIATRAILEAYNKFIESRLPRQQVSGLQSEDDNTSARDSNATPSDSSGALVFASLSDEEITERYILYLECMGLFDQLYDQVRDQMRSIHGEKGPRYLSKCNFGEFGTFDLANDQSTNIFLDWVLNGWITGENTGNMFSPSRIGGRVARSVADFKQIRTFLQFKAEQFNFSKKNNLGASCFWSLKSLSSVQRALYECKSAEDISKVRGLLHNEFMQSVAREKELGPLREQCRYLHGQIQGILTKMRLEQSMINGVMNSGPSIIDHTKQSMINRVMNSGSSIIDLPKQSMINTVMNSGSSINDLTKRDKKNLEDLKIALEERLEKVKKLQGIHQSCEAYLAKRSYSAYLISCGCGFFVQWMSPLRYLKVSSTLALLNLIRGDKDICDNIDNNLKALNQAVVGAVKKYKLKSPDAVSSKEDQSTVIEDGEFSRTFKP